MTIEEAIIFAEYAQIMADGKPDVQEFYRLAEVALRYQKEKQYGEWISVKDRVPYHLQTVIAFHKEGNIEVEEYRALALLNSFSRENFLRACHPLATTS